MKAGHKATIAAAITISALAAAGAQADDARPNNRFAAELLDAHNNARAEFGAPRMEWDDGLARQARKWAEVLAREGQMRHASQSDGSARVRTSGWAVLGHIQPVIWCDPS